MKDPLHALVEEWRKQGEPSEYHDGPNCDKYLALVYHECADELEDALSFPAAQPADGALRETLILEVIRILYGINAKIEEFYPAIQQRLRALAAQTQEPK